jgi:hypothetical protein
MLGNCLPRKNAGVLMPRNVSFLLCRYSFQYNQKKLSISEQYDTLKRIVGMQISYRKGGETTPDTFIMRPNTKEMAEKNILVWEVAQQIQFRQKRSYLRETDEVIVEFEETDEIRSTKFISIPSLGVLAVEDRTAEWALNARSAVGRVRAVLQNLAQADFAVAFAGSNEDVQKALDTWTLEKFSFTVRPFNPTIRKPGEKLDELLRSDGVGLMRGEAKASGSRNMRDSHSGLISEAKGLSDAGYGQIGAAGRTPEGLRAVISKPKFTEDKQKNLKRQAEDRVLKIYLEPQLNENLEEEAVVRALIELYDND